MTVPKLYSIPARAGVVAEDVAFVSLDCGSSAALLGSVSLAVLSPAPSSELTTRNDFGT